MTGPTHKRGGVTSALVTFIVVENIGAMPEGVAPILVFIMLLYFGEIGSVMSDIDHHKDSVPLRDPISISLNFVLHMGGPIRRRLPKRSIAYKILGVFDAKHRSWQTHSDGAIVGLVILYIWLGNTQGVLSHNSMVLAKPMVMGLIAGMIAHIILDSITPQGCHSVVGKGINWVVGHKVLPEKFRIVPKGPKIKSGGYYFSTGGPWEGHVKLFLGVANWLLSAWCVKLLINA